mgnify:CR=1 FL=1
MSSNHSTHGEVWSQIDRIKTRLNGLEGDVLVNANDIKHIIQAIEDNGKKLDRIVWAGWVGTGALVLASFRFIIFGM